MEPYFNPTRIVNLKQLPKTSGCALCLRTPHVASFPFLCGVQMRMMILIPMIDRNKGTLNIQHNLVVAGLNTAQLSPSLYFQFYCTGINSLDFPI